MKFRLRFNFAFRMDVQLLQQHVLKSLFFLHWFALLNICCLCMIIYFWTICSPEWFLTLLVTPVWRWVPLTGETWGALILPEGGLTDGAGFHGMYSSLIWCGAGIWTKRGFKNRRSVGIEPWGVKFFTPSPTPSVWLELFGPVFASV